MAGDAEEKAAGDADRHRDQDRGEGHHGALPLPEDGEIEKAEADQDRQPAAAGVEADQRDDGGDRHPGERRREHDRVRAFAAQEAGRQDRQRHRVGHVDRRGDRPGQVGEGEDAEGGVVDQPVHRRRDPGLGRNLEIARIDHGPVGEAIAEEPEHCRAGEHRQPRPPG